MNVGRVILSAVRVYAGVVVVATASLALWLVNTPVILTPEIALGGLFYSQTPVVHSSFVAGLWFAVAGFGVLIVATFAMVQLAR